jgi:hypothetical protein
MKHASTLSDNYIPLFAISVVVFTFFGMIYLMFNLFGMDRGGFRQLVLLPVQRKYILLGKNLAFLPIAMAIGLIYLIVVEVCLRLSFTVVLATFLQLIAAFLLLSIIGNFISILVPFRLAPGSLKQTKTSTKTTIMILISRFFFPVAIFPISLPPALGLLLSHLGLLPAGPVNLVLSMVLLAVLLFFYKISLPTLGELLLSREKQILQVVTKEVE